MKTKLSKKTKKAICIYLAVLLLLYIVVQLLPKVTDVFETTQILRPGTLKLSYETDLSDLGLDTIEETEDFFEIGCMTTLRQLEQHGGLDRYTGGAVKEAVKNIVGVQFRNTATVGGSFYGRYGFSDVLTAFMAMDTYVVCHNAGIEHKPQ